jgi:hypothetical protein
MPPEDTPPVETPPETPAIEAETPTANDDNKTPPWFKAWSDTFDGRMSAVERRLLGNDPATPAAGEVASGSGDVSASTGDTDTPTRARARFQLPERIPLREHTLFRRPLSRR